MSIRGLDKYLDPPDEPETPLCESCGHEMEEIQYPAISMKSSQTYHIPMTVCPNSFCPDKHTGIAKEMAERIVELEEENETLRLKVTMLKRMNGIDTVSNKKEEK